MNEQKINRGTHGDSLLILVSLETLSKKPPLQAWNAKWWEHVTFSKRAESFQDRLEIFPNPWFLDEDNYLSCFPGKFCEPSEWLEPVKEFFEQRGYKLSGEVDIIWESEKGFDEYARKQSYKYHDWRRKLYRVNCEYLK